MTNENQQQQQQAVATAPKAPPPTTQQRFAAMVTLLKKYEAPMQAILPKQLTAERMMRYAIEDVRRTPALLNCDPRSFALAIMQCSLLGLEPGSALGLAYLVPYAGECKMIVGYKGLLQLARESGRVAWIDANVVHQGDVFEYELGTAPHIKHVPSLDAREAKDIGQVRAVWAAAKVFEPSAKHLAPDLVMEVLSLGEVLRVKAVAKAGNVWANHFDEMARKTALRRICKRLPQPRALALAIDAEEREERGEPADLSALMEIPGIGELVPESFAAAALEEPKAPAETIKEKLRDAEAKASRAEPAKK